MLSCPKDELRVLEKLLRPSPELELEMEEEDWEAPTAEATAESILGSRAAMICAMMSACDRLPLLGFLAATAAPVLDTSSTPARGPVHAPGISLICTAPFSTSLVSE